MLKYINIYFLLSLYNKVGNFNVVFICNNINQFTEHGKDNNMLDIISHGSNTFSEDGVIL